MNNISILRDISSYLFSTLNNRSIHRINPIFQYEPLKYIENSTIQLQFPNSLEDFDSLKISQEYRQPEIMWFVFSGLILRSHMPTDLHSQQKVDLVLLKDCPIYISCIIEAVRKYSRNSMIIIDDKLPEALFINIELDFSIKKERESLLKSLAINFIQEGKNRQAQKAMDKVLADNKIPFKKAVQEILNLKGVGVQGDFSYCLSCGDAIDRLNSYNKPKYFCKREKRFRKNMTASNPDNCRNVFRYWQKSRLQLMTDRERREHLLKLYSELQSIIQQRALVAFEQLQDNHSQLYKDGRKKHRN